MHDFAQFHIAICCFSDFPMPLYPIPMMPAIAADLSKFVDRTILHLQSCAYAVNQSLPSPSTSPLSQMVLDQPCPDIYRQTILAAMEEHIAFNHEGPPQGRAIVIAPRRSPRNPGHLHLAITAFAEVKKAAQLPVFQNNPLPVDFCQFQAFLSTFMAGASGGQVSDIYTIPRLVYLYRAIVDDPLPGAPPTELDAATEKWIADTCYKMAADLLGYPCEESEGKIQVSYSI